MATHKHWSTPAQAETPVESTPTTIAAPLTHVWIAKYEDQHDQTIRLYLTEEGCKKWRQDIALENWEFGPGSDDEEIPEDLEKAADRYFEYSEETDGDQYFSYYKECIRS